MSFARRPDESPRLAIDLEPLVAQIVARLRPMLNGEAPVPAKRAFRIPEVAELLSLSVSEIEILVAQGEIESIKVGRARLIPASAIDRFIDGKLAHGRNA
jgi:excisionase family DNA binding protein